MYLRFVKPTTMRIYTYILIALLLLSMRIVGTAQSMSDVWKDIPKSIVPTVSNTSRLDMIDLYQAGMTARTTTSFGDEAQILVMGESYMAVRTSQASVLQIKRLGKIRRPIYAVVVTVETPVPHSRVELYNAKWEAISLDKRLPRIGVEAFVSDSLKGDYRKLLLSKVKVRTIQYNMSEESCDLIVVPSFMQILDENTRQELTPYIKPQIRLSWQGKKWVLKQ